MKRLLLGFVFVQALIWASFASADSYEIVSQTNSNPASGLKKTVYLVQVVTSGGTVRNPINRFKITRVRRTSGNIVGPVLLRSPFNFDSRFYEITKGTANNYKTSLLGNLAEKRLDVWSVDDRVNTAAPGSCENNSIDCSIMSTWDISHKIGDIEFARSLIEDKYPDTKPVIGGFVGGSIDAMAAVDANPTGYSGFFGWEGTLYSEDQAVKDYNAPFCAFAQSLITNGIFFDPNAGLFRFLIVNAQTAPNDPAPPLPFPLPPGLTNRETLYYLMGNHLDNPNFPTPTWITAASTYQPPNFPYTEESQLFQFVPIVNDYVATTMFVDYSCGLAGARTFNNNLGAFEGSVLLYGNQFAFGGPIQDTANLFTNADSVDVEYFPNFGEQDLYLNKHRRKLADKPFIRWAKEVLRNQ